MRRPAHSASESLGSPANFSAVSTKVRAAASLTWQRSLSQAAMDKAPSPRKASVRANSAISVTMAPWCTEMAR